MKKLLLHCYHIFCRIIFGYKNAVVFISFSGKSYSDNPRPVSEKLHEISPKTKIIWLFKNPEEKQGSIPSYIKCVNVQKTLSANKWLAIAKCIVNNCAFSGDTKKGKKQFIVQLWHGDRSFKKVLYDSEFIPENYALAEAKAGFCDIAVSGSDYGDMQYRSAFRFDGEILKEGTPRDDVLVRNDPQVAAIIRRAIGCEGKKILMYAPTWRRENAVNRTAQEQQKGIDLEKTIAVLKEITGEDWIALVRSHPSVPTLNVADKEGVIKNVSSYEDMADLLLVSDFLITDFSSSAGDYALLRRPIILFQSDMKEYLKTDRGFYFDMNESPYYIAETQEEIEHLIRTVTPSEYATNCDEILKFYGTVETGRSSEAVVNRLVAFMEKGQRKP